jgi:hypothetical protein
MKLVEISMREDMLPSMVASSGTTLSWRTARLQGAPMTVFVPSIGQNTHRDSRGCQEQQSTHNSKAVFHDDM